MFVCYNMCYMSLKGVYSVMIENIFGIASAIAEETAAVAGA